MFYTTERDTSFVKRDTESKREITINTSALLNSELENNIRVKKEDNPRLRKERLIICAKEVE